MELTNDDILCIIRRYDIAGWESLEPSGVSCHPDNLEAFYQEVRNDIVDGYATVTSAHGSRLLMPPLRRKQLVLPTLVHG